MSRKPISETFLQLIPILYAAEKPERRTEEMLQRNQGRRRGKSPLYFHGKYFTIIGPISFVTGIGRCRHIRMASRYFGFSGFNLGS